MQSIASSRQWLLKMKTPLRSHRWSGRWLGCFDGRFWRLVCSKGVVTRFNSCNRDFYHYLLLIWYNLRVTQIARISDCRMMRMVNCGKESALLYLCWSRWNWNHSAMHITPSWCSEWAQRYRAHSLRLFTQRRSVYLTLRVAIAQSARYRSLTFMLL